MICPLLSARDLAPYADGFLRIERANIHAQILLHLSQDVEQPTKLQHLDARLPQFTYQQIVDALRRLVLRKLAANVGHGLYVARYGRIPGADA